MLKHPDYSSVEKYLKSTTSIDRLPDCIQDIVSYCENKEEYKEKIKQKSLHEFRKHVREIKEELVPYLKSLGVRRISVSFGMGGFSLVAPIGHKQLLRISLKEMEDRYDLSQLPVVLKPLVTTQKGSFLIDVCPYVNTEGVTDEDTLFCAVMAREFGFLFLDCKANNVGLLPNGLPVIIDLGSLVPHAHLGDSPKTYSKHLQSKPTFNDLTSPDTKVRIRGAMIAHEQLGPYTFDPIFGEDKELRNEYKKSDDKDKVAEKAINKLRLCKQMHRAAAAFPKKSDLVRFFDYRAHIMGDMEDWRSLVNEHAFPKTGDYQQALADLKKECSAIEEDRKMSGSDKKKALEKLRTKTEAYPLPEIRSKRDKLEERMRNYYLAAQKQLLAKNKLSYDSIKGAISDQDLVELVKGMRGPSISNIKKAVKESVIARTVIDSGLDQEIFVKASRDAVKEATETNDDWHDILRKKYTRTNTPDSPAR